MKTPATEIIGRLTGTVIYSRYSNTLQAALRESAAPGTLARIDADRSVHAAAGDLLFANGMAFVNDGKTLIVAETYRGCLTAFDIESTGDLVNRRLWAQLPEGDVPDGICVDAEEVI